MSRKFYVQLPRATTAGDGGSFFSLKRKHAYVVLGCKGGAHITRRLSSGGARRSRDTDSRRATGLIHSSVVLHTFLVGVRTVASIRKSELPASGRNLNSPPRVGHGRRRLTCSRSVAIVMRPSN